VLLATNRDLKAAAEQGAIKSDLSRPLQHAGDLAGPLRGAAGDLPALVQYFVSYHERRSRSAPWACRGSAAGHGAYAWPGNVRGARPRLFAARDAGPPGARLDVAHLERCTRSCCAHRRCRARKRALGGRALSTTRSRPSGASWSWPACSATTGTWARPAGACGCPGRRCCATWIAGWEFHWASRSSEASSNASPGSESGFSLTRNGPACQRRGPVLDPLRVPGFQGPEVSACSTLAPEDPSRHEGLVQIDQIVSVGKGSSTHKGFCGREDYFEGAPAAGQSHRAGALPAGRLFAVRALAHRTQLRLHPYAAFVRSAARKVSAARAAGGDRRPQGAAGTR